MFTSPISMTTALWTMRSMTDSAILLWPRQHLIGLASGTLSIAHRLPSAPEQERVAGLLVAVENRVELGWHGEDGVVVADVEQVVGSRVIETRISDEPEVMDDAVEVDLSFGQPSFCQKVSYARRRNRCAVRLE